MPNPILKSFTLSATLGLCACVVPPGSDVYHPYKPPVRVPRDYNPLIKLTSVPNPFRPGQQVTFTSSMIAKPVYKVQGGDNPTLLELRAVPGDKDGNPTGAEAHTSVVYPGPDSSNWVTVTFDPLTIPQTAPGGTLKVTVTFKHYLLGQYLPVSPDPEPPRTVFYTLQCGTGDPRASICVYKRM